MLKRALSLWYGVWLNHRGEMALDDKSWASGHNLSRLGRLHVYPHL